jgi:hypothetical protein
MLKSSASSREAIRLSGSLRDDEWTDELSEPAGEKGRRLKRLFARSVGDRTGVDRPEVEAVSTMVDRLDGLCQAR